MWSYFQNENFIIEKSSFWLFSTPKSIYLFSCFDKDTVFRPKSSVSSFPTLNGKNLTKCRNRKKNCRHKHTLLSYTNQFCEIWNFGFSFRKLELKPQDSWFHSTRTHLFPHFLYFDFFFLFVVHLFCAPYFRNAIL